MSPYSDHKLTKESWTDPCRTVWDTFTGLYSQIEPFYPMLFETQTKFWPFYSSLTHSNIFIRFCFQDEPNRWKLTVNFTVMQIPLLMHVRVNDSSCNKKFLWIMFESFQIRIRVHLNKSETLSQRLFWFVVRKNSRSFYFWENNLQNIVMVFLSTFDINSKYILLSDISL